MGMFDSVLIDCPVCQHVNEFQTKSGDCCLGCYNAAAWMPIDLLSGMDHECCDKCSHVYHAAVKDMKFAGNEVMVILHAVSGLKEVNTDISPMGNPMTLETLHQENKRLLAENENLRRQLDQVPDLYRVKDFGF